MSEVPDADEVIEDVKEYFKKDKFHQARKFQGKGLGQSPRSMSSKPVKMGDDGAPPPDPHEPFIEERIRDYKSAPFDPRFPQWNAAARCRQNYIDYHRCQSVMKAKGESARVCDYFKLVYNDVCPNIWTSRWDEQMEEGTFPEKVTVVRD